MHLPPVRRAVIDVGTNSVKLLLAEVDEENIQPLLERSTQTRLGQSFYETHLLQPKAIEQTAQAVTAFAALASEWQPATTRLIATSAARDAKNQEQLISALQDESGLKVEIISGEEEAELVFRGIATDQNLHGHPLLILDVGGGSTEFILGSGCHHSFRKSFPLGGVRLLEKLRPHDPPTAADQSACRHWLKTFLDEQITRQLPDLLSLKSSSQTQLVGTGGTATILARMQKQLTDFDRAQIEGTRINHAQIVQWMAQLWSLSVAERRMIPGIPSNRADIILMGMAIYEALMEHFHFTELYVSTRGLRFGALMDQTKP